MQAYACYFVVNVQISKNYTETIQPFNAIFSELVPLEFRLRTSLAIYWQYV